MKRLFILFLPFFAFNSFFVKGQTVNSDYVDGAAYLKVWDSSAVDLDPLPNIPALNLILTTFSVDTLYRAFPDPNPSLNRIYRLSFGNISLVNSLIAQLEQLPFVEFAEPVPLMQFVGSESFTPDDLDILQWHLPKVQAEDAWGITQGDSSVLIAIVDNAVSTSHSDLMGDIYVNPGEVPGNGLDDDFNGYRDDVSGWDAADSDGNPNPPAGINAADLWNHGTHCAGIAGAETDNGNGIASLGFRCKILPVKASKNILGGGSLTHSYEGVHYAVQAGADVISMSFGGSGTSLTGNLIIQNAYNRGIVLVAGAGNNNSSSPFYPAAYSGVIAVGATDQNDLKASFSNYGSYVDVMAPGVNIYSTLADAPNSYAGLSGTSMACPLVSGLCGLMLSVSPNLDPGDVELALESGCLDLDSLNPNFAGQLGAGRINAFNSLNLLVNREFPVARPEAKVYPNPFGLSFTLDLPDDAQDWRVEILDLQGRLLRSWEPEPGSSSRVFSPADLVPGLYWLRLVSRRGEQSQIIKLIKQ